MSVNSDENLDDVQKLENSIFQYEEQLSNIRHALQSAPKECRNDLLCLQTNIQELIALTKENVLSLKKKESVEKKETDCKDDPFASELALFQAEIENLNDSSSAGKEANGSLTNEKANGQGKDSTKDVASDIQSDLEATVGMKCQAPHKHNWGGISYHNAMVCDVVALGDVSDIQEIMVRVLFCNPTHREMKPCPYFLSGECRFSEGGCHFSHGETVQFSELKEFRPPDFSLIKEGSHVLAKQSDELWHRGTVLSVQDKNSCVIKIEGSKDIVALELPDIMPLEGSGEGSDESSSDSDDSSDSEDRKREEEELEKAAVAEFVGRSLANAPLDRCLGDWEKYTKGIGSKLMAKMGYIVGTGLGPSGEGRMEPVEVVVLPPGKSLDHCMDLKEQAGDEDLFRMERRLKREQKKRETQMKRQYLKAQEQRHASVFDFLNTAVSGDKGVSDIKSMPSTSGTSSRGKAPEKVVLKDESLGGLNKRGVIVGEEIRRSEKELSKLHEALARHSGATTAAKIQNQIALKKGEIGRLQASERKIQHELGVRKDKKKLSIF